MSTGKKAILTGILVLSALALGGCGKQQYLSVSAEQVQQAPGHFTIPAKVDIILAEDDSGSIKEVYSQIAQQFPEFLKGLESRGWDYHFANIPLTQNRAMNQVIGSHYDSGWGGLWKAPYPGALPDGPGMIASNVFRTPDTYSGFLSYWETTNASNGVEQGLENIRNTLYDREPGTGFLRPDAMLVVLVVGNGQDTSRINYCDRGDGIVVPCEDAGKPLCTSMSQTNSGQTCGSRDLSFNWYKQQLQGLKADPAQMKFHAAVAPYNTSSCLGSQSWAGTRYRQMATATGGANYDVCSQSISGVLTSLSDSLQNQKLAMRTRYLFIAEAPELSTVQVTKYVNGDAGQAQLIPMDSVNGWTYSGYVSNVYAIDYPTPLNLSSGFGIELHGSAKLTGGDTANVTFQHQGAQDSQK